MSRIDSDSGNSSDSDSVDSTYEEGTEGTQDSPMMSIFASYYGIEEPIDEATVKPKGTIDDANFEPETFVRVCSASNVFFNTFCFMSKSFNVRICC